MESEERAPLARSPVEGSYVIPQNVRDAKLSGKCAFLVNGELRATIEGSDGYLYGREGDTYARRGLAKNSIEPGC